LNASAALREQLYLADETPERWAGFPPFKNLGLFDGSASIESAQRQIIQIRTKRLGQRWGSAS
jgi:hypothetical protein